MSTTLGVLVGIILTLFLALVGVASTSAARFEPDPRFAAAAGATSPEPEPVDEDPFRSLDFNADGRVSIAEAAGDERIVSRFYRADRNKDGKLTKAEYDRLLKLKDRKPRTKKKKS